MFGESSRHTSRDFAKTRGNNIRGSSFFHSSKGPFAIFSRQQNAAPVIPFEWNRSKIRTRSSRIRRTFPSACFRMDPFLAKKEDRSTSPKQTTKRRRKMAVRRIARKR
jgi:hypothetical protein